jgi:predicted RNA-binding Zn-ribbon protein involved in translation (DUF1610 family)
MRPRLLLWLVYRWIGVGLGVVSVVKFQSKHMKIIQPISSHDNEKQSHPYYNILSCGHDAITPEMAMRVRCPVCGTLKSVIRRVLAGWLVK